MEKMYQSLIYSKGREVPEAENLIKFYVKGDAKTIGVVNGDPSSHEPDKYADDAWQRKCGEFVKK